MSGTDETAEGGSEIAPLTRMETQPAPIRHTRTERIRALFRARMDRVRHDSRARFAEICAEVRDEPPAPCIELRTLAEAPRPLAGGARRDRSDQ